MENKEIYQETDEALKERHTLLVLRLKEILSERTVEERYREYFKETAEFLLYLDRLLEQEQNHTLFQVSMEECKKRNDRLYGRFMGEHYEACFGNPSYAVKLFGREAGEMLSFMYSELQAGTGYVFEGRMDAFVMLGELFVQVYNCFEGTVDLKEARQTIYWYFHDYSEIFAKRQVEEMVDPKLDFCTKIIMESDLSDLRYLYRYGLPVGENEIKTAEYLNSMPETEIQAMADTYTEGYRIGFEVTGKDISKKKTVSLHYALGFERMMRAAIGNFEKIGLRPTIAKEAFSSFFGKGGAKRGAYSSSVNKQYDFDHREDKAYYFDKSFVERRLEALRTAFEQNKKAAAEHGGPAVLETFGEEPFSPAVKEEAIHYSEKQQQLNVYHASMSGQITNEYVKGEERSFTIIAYPVPAIGKQFPEIFAETVKINTLDYKKYQNIQQKLIDVLDTAREVRIKGKGANQTDLTVSIWALEEPARQTAFENCVADVNIPVGEVFTSPVLKETSGILHVSEVFLNELQYQNLTLEFKDGMIKKYSCTNFEKIEENEKYIKDNVLMHHDTLPMGEFAIGTNTTAYRMGRKFKINDKLPILIAEKCGPHFAVGDTCYSHAEDMRVYNPDGKEIMPRDNEISVQRKEDISKAYFNCHTDITIPYDELDSIIVVQKNGTEIPVILDGKFVVPGTEELNVPLES
ncbi:Thermophilic metalloprotease (M29) [uncultured Roseburia sp.]|uniref:Aminopeptidase n=1 Tax=Brotonthovivens ammoniilytica TaxID=2981725 RepID=A0ABT2TK42_9FIRM|nr:aminopeptidase [Brotonthovivens ammoniilytica]MCU6762580.1 aminopeptidase [Brotonthovivens ammoniilytica]SCI76306.1 Thermophilic metalloprotease (M29) [uncultured Roseburia sp.]